MPKAHITTKSGSNITIEGTAAEVGRLIAQLEGQPLAQGPMLGRKKMLARGTSKQKASPLNLISSLMDGGFFRKPKDLVAVKVALEEMGHYYPVTTLSPTLLRLVRSRQLRRIKDQKRWLYTG